MTIKGKFDSCKVWSVGNNMNNGVSPYQYDRPHCVVREDDDAGRHEHCSRQLIHLDE
jgi:hypothetical protein